MRLIDADALENDIRKVLHNRHSKRAVLALYMMLNIIRGRDTIKANPVRHGKWKSITNGLWGWKCSACGKEVYSNRKCDVDRYKYPYCPKCGTEMNGDNEKGEKFYEKDTDVIQESI